MKKIELQKINPEVLKTIENLKKSKIERIKKNQEKNKTVSSSEGKKFLINYF